MNQTSSSFLQGLYKKDPDLTVVEDNALVTVVESEIYDVEEIKMTPTEPQMTPHVKIIRHVFAYLLLYCTIATIWGIIPYHLLRMDAPVYVSWIIFGVSGFFLALSYGFLFLTDDSALNLFVFLFFLFMMANASAALLRSLAPFQAIVIVWMQCAAVQVYCFFSKRHLDPIWAGAYMAGASLVGWLAGIYIFMRERDWITAGLLFLLYVLGSSAYSAFCIHLYTKDKLRQEDTTRAFVNYFTNPVLIPVKWIKEQYQTQYPEL